MGVRRPGRLGETSVPSRPDPVLLDLVEERSVADVEELRGVGAVAVGGFEGPANPVGLEALPCALE